MSRGAGTSNISSSAKPHIVHSLSVLENPMFDVTTIQVKQASRRSRCLLLYAARHGNRLLDRSALTANGGVNKLSVTNSQLGQISLKAYTTELVSLVLCKTGHQPQTASICGTWHET